jgi:UDP-N-acetyl-D-glucosamine dehydrogenase
MQRTKKSVAVIGLGYVGWPLAELAAKKKFRVVGIDSNSEKIELLAKNKKGITVSADFSSAREVSTIVICVPTPVHENRTPNLSPVESASESVGKILTKGQLVILESTVNPGVTETIVLPILERASGLKAEQDFFLAHCPERINPGDPKWNVQTIPRVVGGLGEQSLARALKFYRSLLSASITPLNSLKEAEAVKVVENSFRDVNIAFVNELAMSFAKLDIDVVNVIHAASTKPFAFMPHYPGAGVGGHCIPVDPYYLIDYAKQNGFNHRFLSLARDINSSMPHFTVGLVERTLREAGKNLNGSSVAVLGLAYKPDIDDVRESPALEIVKLLEERGATVKTFDPYVPETSTAGSKEEALMGTEAAVIATAHREFTRLSPRDLKRLGVRILIDGRNCLPKTSFTNAGIVYRGIGR